MDWAMHFTYDASSPSGLRWATDRRTGRKYGRIVMVQGSVAGSRSSRGYWHVTLGRKSYPVHRIVLELHGSVLGKAHVDHRDGDGANNEVLNLRSVTRHGNMQNRRKGRNSTSGFYGVYFDNKPNGSGVKRLYAVASWICTLTNKAKTKSVAVHKYGLLPAFKMATEFRAGAINQQNELGANYSARHGS